MRRKKNGIAPLNAIIIIIIVIVSGKSHTVEAVANSVKVIVKTMSSGPMKVSKSSATIFLVLVSEYVCMNICAKVPDLLTCLLLIEVGIAGIFTAWSKFPCNIL